MNAYLDTLESPVGPIVYATDHEGAMLGLKFLDGRYPLTLEQELEQNSFRPVQGVNTAVRKQLLEYFAGERHYFDLPLALRGSEFQIKVWQALTRIPFGETCTYGQLASASGCPGAARAVGRANATNRIPVVIPCHRVIGADGSLSGFAGGAYLKTRLLTFEAAYGSKQTRIS